MRLLIVKLSSIGDVVQALCVLEPLRPRCSHLGWVVETPSLSLLEGHSLVDRVHVFPKERLRSGPGGGALAALRGLRRELSAEGYDAVLDLQGLFKSALVVALSGARRKVGFAATRELSYLALNERVPPGRLERHAVLKYLDLARHLGAEVGRVSFPVEARPEEVARVEALAAGDRPLAVLSPQTRWETKQWSADSFAALARSLVRELGARVMLCGAASDHAILEGIRARSGEPEGADAEEVVNLAGQLNLREFAHLCRLCRVAVSCDSGPMHLAAAVNTPVVALFGPTAPWRTGPFGTIHRVVRKGLTCSPCFRKHCPSRACMEGIGAAEVLEAVRPLWGA